MSHVIPALNIYVVPSALILWPTSIIQRASITIILIIFQNSFNDTLPKAKQNEYVEDRLTNGHANGPVGIENVSSAYAAFGSLDSGDLIQFAWQIANGMV